MTSFVLGTLLYAHARSISCLRSEPRTFYRNKLPLLRHPDSQHFVVVHMSKLEVHSEIYFAD